MTPQPIEGEQRITVARCGICGDVLGIQDVSRIEHERLCIGPGDGLEFVPYVPASALEAAEEKAGIQEMVAVEGGEIIAATNRCRDIVLVTEVQDG